MNYSVDVSPSGKYIIIKVIGEMTVEIGKITNEKADNLGRRLNIKSLLSDLRECVNREKMDANISFSYKKLPKVKDSIFEKVAMLITPGDRSHDIIYITATNAGYNVRMFSEEEEAVKWLET